MDDNICNDLKNIGISNSSSATNSDTTTSDTTNSDTTTSDTTTSGTTTSDTTTSDTTTTTITTITNKNKYPFRLLALLSAYEMETYIDVMMDCPFKKDINNLESELIAFYNNFEKMDNMYIGKKIYTMDQTMQSSLTSYDYGYHEFSNRSHLIWQAEMKIDISMDKFVIKSLPPIEKKGSCIFYEIVGSDRFLECKIYCGNSNSNDKIKDVVWQSFLKDGIEHCGRTYHFLYGEQPKRRKKSEKNYFFAMLFSSDWNCYKYGTDEKCHVFHNTDVMEDISIRRCNLGHSNSHMYQSVDQLVDGFAHFNSTDSVKRNLRLQLGFSSSNSFIICDEDMIEIVPDILSSDDSKVMTDGCGLISSSFFKACKFIPIVIQIRASTKQGLFKGNLIVSDDNDICPVNTIRMRDSMKKADGSMEQERPRSDDNKACVLVKNTFQSDKFRWGMTNHELVLLLQQSGVPGDVFKQLLNRALERLPDLSEQKKLEKSLEKLRDTSKDEDETEDDNKEYTDNVKKLLDMIKSGHNPKTEVYMKMLLEKVQLSQLKKLVSLKVPFYNPDANLYSTSLVGVPDPTGTLDEGEVFISMNFKATNKGSGTLSEYIIVSRYPMGLRGDIRKLKLKSSAEKLEAFVGDRNGSVIFFSTKGTLPAADMMGGGDYDGDTFLIIYGNNIVVQSFIETTTFKYGTSPAVGQGTGSLAVIKSLIKSPEVGIYANKRKHCKYSLITNDIIITNITNIIYIRY